MRRDKHLCLVVTYILLLLATNSFSISGEAASDKKPKKDPKSSSTDEPNRDSESPSTVEPKAAATPPAQPAPTSKLRYNHYRTTKCSKVESVVTNEVVNRSKRDPTIVPALLRLFFHDCFSNVSAFSTY